MVYEICFAIAFVLAIACAVVEFFDERKERCCDEFADEQCPVNKWIYCTESDVLVRIRGAFWLGYAKKEALPFSVNLYNSSLGHYETKEMAKDVMQEIADFLADDSWTIYVMPEA